MEDVVITEAVVVEDEVVVEVEVVVMVVVAVEVAEVIVVEETAPAGTWLAVEAGSPVPNPWPASSNGRGGRGLICSNVAPLMGKINTQ